MALDPNFWKFYLIRTGFILGEPVSLVKVFRLFRLELICFGVQSVVDVQHLIYWQAHRVCDALFILGEANVHHSATKKHSV
jgi:hypothetical protein